VRVTLADNGKIDRISVLNERCEDRDPIRNKRLLFPDLEELLGSHWRMIRWSITSQISLRHPPSASTGICFRNIHPSTSFRHNYSKPVRHSRNIQCRCCRSSRESLGSLSQAKRWSVRITRRAKTTSHWTRQR
jgi:hypothetical protein